MYACSFVYILWFCPYFFWFSVLFVLFGVQCFVVFGTPLKSLHILTLHLCVCLVYVYMSTCLKTEFLKSKKKKKKKKVKIMYVFFHHSENVSIAVTRIFCRAPPVSAGDPANLTCHYPEDLSQSRKGIVVLRRDSIPGSRDGECLSRLSPRGNLTYRATPHPPPHPCLQYAAKLVLKCSLE